MYFNVYLKTKQQFQDLLQKREQILKEYKIPFKTFPEKNQIQFLFNDKWSGMDYVYNERGVYVKIFASYKDVQEVSYGTRTEEGVHNLLCINVREIAYMDFHD